MLISETMDEEGGFIAEPEMEDAYGDINGVMLTMIDAELTVTRKGCLLNKNA